MGVKCFEEQRDERILEPCGTESVISTSPFVFLPPPRCPPGRKASPIQSDCCDSSSQTYALLSLFNYTFIRTAKSPPPWAILAQHKVTNIARTTKGQHSVGAIV